MRYQEILIILLIVLLLFGAPKLPTLARSLGQSMRILKDETRSATSDDDATAPASGSTPKPATSSSDEPRESEK